MESAMDLVLALIAQPDRASLTGKTLEPTANEKTRRSLRADWSAKRQHLAPSRELDYADAAEHEG